MHAVHDAIGDIETKHTMPKATFHATRRDVREHASHKRRENAGTGTPRDVKARYAVPCRSGASAATLGPTDCGKPSHSLRVQPGALLTGGEVEIRFGPFARPVIIGTIEAGGVHPIAMRELA